MSSNFLVILSKCPSIVLQMVYVPNAIEINCSAPVLAKATFRLKPIFCLWITIALFKALPRYFSGIRSLGEMASYPIFFYYQSFLSLRFYIDTFYWDCSCIAYKPFIRSLNIIFDNLYWEFLCISL